MTRVQKLNPEAQNSKMTCAKILVTFNLALNTINSLVQWIKSSKTLFGSSSASCLHRTLPHKWSRQTTIPPLTKSTFVSHRVHFLLFFHSLFFFFFHSFSPLFYACLFQFWILFFFFFFFRKVYFLSKKKTCIYLFFLNRVPALLF